MLSRPHFEDLLCTNRPVGLGDAMKALHTFCRGIHRQLQRCLRKLASGSLRDPTGCSEALRERGSVGEERGRGGARKVAPWTEVGE